MVKLGLNLSVSSVVFSHPGEEKTHLLTLIPDRNQTFDQLTIFYVIMIRLFKSNEMYIHSNVKTGVASIPEIN